MADKVYQVSFTIAVDGSFNDDLIKTYVHDAMHEKDSSVKMSEVTSQDISEIYAPLVIESIMADEDELIDIDDSTELELDECDEVDEATNPSSIANVPGKHKKDKEVCPVCGKDPCICECDELELNL